MKSYKSLPVALCFLALSVPALVSASSVNQSLAASEAQAEFQAVEPVEATRALRYALTCIYNDFSFTLNYQVKWGDGSWKNMSVAPGTWRSHSWLYDPPGDNHSPQLQIKFDSDMNGGLSWLTYNLERYASEDTDCNTKGKKYRFVRDNSAQFIDLRSFN